MVQNPLPDSQFCGPFNVLDRQFQMPSIVRLGQPPTGLGRHALICYRNFYQKTDLVNKHCAVQLGGTLTIASMLSCLYLITDNVAFQDYFYKQIFQFQFQGLGHDVN